MIGMHVREQDRVDLARGNAGGRERLGQMAERRPHAVARAGVDQSEASRRADQKSVDADARRHPAAVTADQILRLGRKVAHHLERGVELAVGEDRDLDVADAARMNRRGDARHVL